MGLPRSKLSTSAASDFTAVISAHDRPLVRYWSDPQVGPASHYCIIGSPALPGDLRCIKNWFLYRASDCFNQGSGDQGEA